MDTLIEQIKKPGAVPLFVTGAGISLASGIPTFRGEDPDAVWSKDVLEKGTVDFFHKHPDQSWAWYLKRFDKARGAQPNQGHMAISKIESMFPNTKVVTQNVDGLHAQAGTKNLVEIHGSARKIRCSNARHCKNAAPQGFLPWEDKLLKEFRANPSMDTLPTCPTCGSVLRAHVLWFDETYLDHEDYQYDKAVHWASKATVVVYVGTSFSVGITSTMLQKAAESEAQEVIIDPNMEDPPWDGMEVVREPAEKFLPRVAIALR